MFSNKNILLEISSDQVHLWFVDLDISPEQQEKYLDSLSADEIKRANKYRFPKDKRVYVVSKAILRILISRYLGHDPNEIVFEYSEYGRPEYQNNQRLDFNVSHSGNQAVLGFTKDLAIGVDIEKIKNDFDALELAENFFSKEEIETLSKISEKDRYNAFYRCWTRKESFIKAVGQGLSYPLDSFAVSLDDDRSAEFLKIDGVPDSRESWQLHSFIPTEGYIAALTLNGNPKKIEFFNWNHETQV